MIEFVWKVNSKPQQPYTVMKLTTEVSTRAAPSSIVELIWDRIKDIYREGCRRRDFSHWTVTVPALFGFVLAAILVSVRWLWSYDGLHWRGRHSRFSSLLFLDYHVVSISGTRVWPLESWEPALGESLPTLTAIQLISAFIVLFAVAISIYCMTKTVKSH